MTTEITDQQRTEFFRVLKEQQKTLLSEIQDINDTLRSAKDATPDPVDAASKIEERNSLMAQMNQKQTVLKEVNQAIDNFEEDFGFCVDCGEPMDINRLRINPSSTECIDCKSKNEHINRINHGTR